MCSNSSQLGVLHCSTAHWSVPATLSSSRNAKSLPSYNHTHTHTTTIYTPHNLQHTTCSYIIGSWHGYHITESLNPIYNREKAEFLVTVYIKVSCFPVASVSCVSRHGDAAMLHPSQGELECVLMMRKIMESAVCTLYHHYLLSATFHPRPRDTVWLWTVCHLDADCATLMG